jgi:Double zinc ribbon
MKCSKCGQENLKAIEFCVRCHHPLRFTCPSCKNIQDHSGKCDKCGADFAKFAAMMVFQAQTNAQRARESARDRHSVMKQILLLPITGGFSLIKYFRSKMRGD